jgi:xanthine dehydrogenase large subunit
MHTRLERPKDDEAPRTVRRALAHDSAERHVAGSAAYLDDLREPEGTLHVAPGGSPIARGQVKSVDF